MIWAIASNTSAFDRMSMWLLGPEEQVEWDTTLEYYHCCPVKSITESIGCLDRVVLTSCRCWRNFAHTPHVWILGIERKRSRWQTEAGRNVCGVHLDRNLNVQP